MRATDTRRLGRTAVDLTVLGFGGSQVGNLHRPVPEDDAARAIGIGVNSWRVCQAAAEAVDVDCVLLAGRYTLLEQEALAFLSLCERRSIGVIVGAPYNSGILARGAAPGAQHNYAAPSPEIAE